MPNVKITTEVTDNTDEFIRLMQEGVRVALEVVGLQAENYAKYICPVDTGRLRNSITHTSDGEYAYIGTNVEYAPYVEYGTSKTQAQPFLKPAANDHTEEYKETFEEYLRAVTGS